MRLPRIDFTYVGAVFALLAGVLMGMALQNDYRLGTVAVAGKVVARYRPLPGHTPGYVVVIDAGDEMYGDFVDQSAYEAARPGAEWTFLVPQYVVHPDEAMDRYLARLTNLMAFCLASSIACVILGMFRMCKGQPRPPEPNGSGSCDDSE